MRHKILPYLSIAVLVCCFLPASMADPDIWWHLRNAQMQWATHSFLRYDTFSYTAAGSPWMDHEWLAEMPFYMGYRLLGPEGLYWVTLATLEVIFAGVLTLSYVHCRSIVAAMCATVPGVLLATVSFGPRTLLFGWVLLVAELVIFELARRNSKWVWAMPPMFLVWVNTHGSWVIGLVLFGLFLLSCAVTVCTGSIENQARPRPELFRFCAAGCGSVAALFVNPYGWRLVLYPFNLAFRQTLNIASIEEWKSTDFHTPRGRVLFGYLLILFLLQLVRGRKWSLFELALAFVGVYSALTYARFLFLAAILLPPLLARSLGTRPGPSLPRKTLSPLLQGALCMCIAGLLVGHFRARRPFATRDDIRFPAGALAYLSTHPLDGPVFNDYLWGGFLIWHARQIPVFVDSRVDIFEYNGTFKDYLDIEGMKSSLPLLDRHAIKYVLFARDTPLVSLLQTTNAWRTDYLDEHVILLERLPAGAGGYELCRCNEPGEGAVSPAMATGVVAVTRTISPGARGDVERLSPKAGRRLGFAPH